MDEKRLSLSYLIIIVFFPVYFVDLFHLDFSFRLRRRAAGSGSDRIRIEKRRVLVRRQHGCSFGKQYVKIVVYPSSDCLLDMFPL